MGQWLELKQRVHRIHIHAHHAPERIHGGIDKIATHCATPVLLWFAGVSGHVNARMFASGEFRFRLEKRHARHRLAADLPAIFAMAIKLEHRGCLEFQFQRVAFAAGEVGHLVFFA